MTRIYYRIQPAGLPLAGHRSESSGGVVEGVDVFTQAQDVLRPDAPVSFYGDEVVVIAAPGHWSNGDVEGVRIDGTSARVVTRLPWTAFAEMCESSGLESDVLDDAIDALFAELV